MKTKLDITLEKAKEFKAKGNLRKAIKFYEKAAENGSVPARLALGEIYEDQGDDTLSFKWYHKAALRDDAEALYKVGHCYLMGYGVERNEQKAAEYFKAAANKNHPLGLFEYGLALYLGRGVEEYQGLGIDYACRAAALGCERALMFLNKANADSFFACDGIVVTKEILDLLDDFAVTGNYESLIKVLYKYRYFSFYTQSDNLIKEIETYIGIDPMEVLEAVIKCADKVNDNYMIYSWFKVYIFEIAFDIAHKVALQEKEEDIKNCVKRYKEAFSKASNGKYYNVALNDICINCGCCESILSYKQEDAYTKVFTTPLTMDNKLKYLVAQMECPTCNIVVTDEE